MSLGQEENRKHKSIGKPHPKTQFTMLEDMTLKKLVSIYGDSDWELISKMMVSRNPRQCRERWNKFLSDSINKEPWTEEENNLLISKYKELGPKWMKISKFFNARTDVYIKNRWNIIMRKEKLKQKLEQISKAQANNKKVEVVSEKPEETFEYDLFDINPSFIDEATLMKTFGI